MSESVHEELIAESADKGPGEYVSRRGRRMLAALIVILIIILLLTTLLLTQLLRPAGVPDQGDLGGVTWIRSIYGYGPDVSQMIEPSSAAVAREAGQIWVTDQVRFRLLKFDAGNGNLLQELAGDATRDDTFTYPSRIAIAPDGWIYVTESTYDKVRVFDEDGVQVQSFDIPSPLSVAVNDEMFVVGAQAGFAAYTRDGELMGIIGERGKGEEQFDGVNGVELDDENNAYVIDSFNNRISKYDGEGFLVWMVETGPPGNQSTGGQMDAGELAKFADEYPAMMQVPMGATIDGAGRLIVIDLLDFSIAAFDAEDGSFLGKWGEYGDADGKFAYPADIDYDESHDWFVVADSGNRRAQIIRLPDSGGTAASALRRLLAGPLRACCFPLLLLVILLALWVLVQRRRKRREAQVTEGGVALSIAGSTEPESSL